MTSEVLIMTPSAVAMAADSVVTINGNKTYEGVNKLFMLSKNPPMGIMIYNNANFIAIPFETLIKDFRNQIIDDETVNTVNEFKDKFKEYLENEPKKNNFPMISLKDKIKIFTDHMAKEVNNLNEKTIDQWIIKNKCPNFFDEYKDIIFNEKESLKDFNNSIKNIVPKLLNSTKKTDLYELLRNIFIQIMVLENYTGVAIVGFESDKLFPSCTLFKIRYIYEDKFIFDDVEFDEVGEKGVIFAPLAQTDVIELFLTSLDEKTEEQLKMYFNNVIEGYNGSVHYLKFLLF